MFVLSVKSDKAIKIAVCFLLICALSIGGIISVAKNRAMPVSNIGGISMRAETHEERMTFFSQFGWEIDENPVQVKEVIIPQEFDETYEEYNDIQRQQNLDLEKYKGARVKMWSYNILNYPGYENTDGIILGNILVYEDIVIGGDVCSSELGGFMHTFTLPTEDNQ
ncbi:MAG: DUF4830 domain-containing protein [Clostridia bacterium]|nr:DUF4830 domain-containing protein [Clostridia bacterium]